MQTQTIRLKKLLRDRHWQKYSTFCKEYDKAASRVDKTLVGQPPSRGQLHRWLAGELKGLPYPDHCRVLETMFPGWAAETMFELVSDNAPIPDSFGVDQLVRAVGEAFQAPDAERVEWSPQQPHTSSNAAQQPVKLDNAVGSSTEEIPDSMQKIAKKLVALARVLRLDPKEAARLASLSGQVVELEMRVDIMIGEQGHSQVTYHHELFNMSGQPVSRIAREVWFEHTPSTISIKPIDDAARKVLIQRIHDTPGLAKFACQISPPIQPGETGVVAYTCSGGQFISDHYWRQSLPRYTRHVTIALHHRAVGRLLGYSAVEEQQNGSENSVTEDLLWDNDGDDVIVTLTRDYLRPGQSLTMRWEVEHIEREMKEQEPAAAS